MKGPETLRILEHSIRTLKKGLYSPIGRVRFFTRAVGLIFFAIGFSNQVGNGLEINRAALQRFQQSGTGDISEYIGLELETAAMKINISAANTALMMAGGLMYGAIK